MRAAPSARRQSGFTLLEVLLRGAAMLTGWHDIATTQSGAMR
ncbi:MAG: type II secretion system protein [Aeromonas sp.]